jgi:hypothetical protein
MKKIVTLLMSGLMTLNSFTVKAADPLLPQINVPESEVNVGEAISPLRKGQKAPFTGVLLSPAAVASLTVRLSFFQDEIQLEINKIKAEAAAEIQLSVSQKKAEFEADMAIIKANLEFSEKQKDLLQKSLDEEIKNRPSRSTWFSLGILAGTGVTLTILFATRQSGI